MNPHQKYPLGENLRDCNCYTLTLSLIVLQLAFAEHQFSLRMSKMTEKRIIKTF